MSGHPIVANEWTAFELAMTPSTSESGALSLKVGEDDVALSGSNIYNDKRGPFIKLGVYKPTSWTAEDEYCVEYRNIEIK